MNDKIANRAIYASAREEVQKTFETGETCPSNLPPKLGLNFTEAVGKVIAFLNIVNDPPSWQGLEIRFTDGTLFYFEFQTAPVQIVVEYLELRHGDLKPIRDYGLVPAEKKGTSAGSI